MPHLHPQGRSTQGHYPRRGALFLQRRVLREVQEGLLMSSWMKRLLRVSLSPGKIEKAEFPREWREAYVGGRGVGAKIIWKETPAGCDPLGEENLLIFATGPLTGTAIPMSGRFSASTKSPLAGIIFDSNRRFRGWDGQGRPKQHKSKSLDISGESQDEKSA